MSGEAFGESSGNISRTTFWEPFGESLGTISKATFWESFGSDFDFFFEVSRENLKEVNVFLLFYFDSSRKDVDPLPPWPERFVFLFLFRLF